MNRLTVLLSGAMATFAIALFALIIIPYWQLHRVQPSAAVRPYTEAEQRGRTSYIKNGCVYCHSQQVRDPRAGADAHFGWGRPSVPGDYVHDRPHLLGTMRTGPDLSNIGERQPSVDWHLAHLYNPRAVIPWSIMPALPFLFEVKPSADPGDHVVALPPGVQPGGQVVVAKKEALELVEYLLSLRRNGPVANPVTRNPVTKKEELGSKP